MIGAQVRIDAQPKTGCARTNAGVRRSQANRDMPFCICAFGQGHQSDIAGKMCFMGDVRRMIATLPSKFISSKA